MTALHFTQTRGSDAVLKTSLEVAGLPADDLGEPGRDYWALSNDERLLGYVGLEGDGPDRLLRSLVVLPTVRRQGHGAMLLARVEAHAVSLGVERLHLLTAGPAGFFERPGYVRADRDQAPAAIAATRQFSSLCPAGAACLVKHLS